MATTSPDNLWTPDAGDDYALTVDLAAFADTVQNALNTFRNPPNVVSYNYSRPSAGDSSVITDNISMTLNSSESSGTNFVTSVSGGNITLPAGIYDISFLIRFGAPGVGRQFAEFIRPSPVVLLARDSAPAGEDSVSMARQAYRLPSGGDIFFRFYKATGNTQDVTGNVTIRKIY